MILQQLRAASNEDALGLPGDDNGVVSDQAVPPLHQVEADFALAYGAATDDEKADSVDIDEGAVHGDLGREDRIEVEVQEVDELGCVEFRSEQGDVVLVCKDSQLGKQAAAAGHHDTGEFELVDDFQRLQALVRRQAAEVVDFEIAEDLDRGECEDLDETGKGQTRTMGVRAVDGASDPLVPGEQTQAQRAPVLFQQCIYRQFRHSAVGSGRLSWMRLKPS